MIYITYIDVKYEIRLQMEDLSNPESELYKKILEKQKQYIDKRLYSIKNRYLDDKMGCSGEKEVIAKHLNQGPAQNLVQTLRLQNVLYVKEKKEKMVLNSLKERIVIFIRVMIC